MEDNNKKYGPWLEIWIKILRNKFALVGLIILGIIVFLVVLAPILTPYERDTMDFMNTNTPPSLKHLLGTDELGRDYLTRMLYGGRISLKVGIFSVGISVFLAMLVGGISGYYGKIIDNILMRFSEIVYSFPFLPLAITLSAIFGSRVKPEQKMYIIMFIIGILSWPGLARVIRGQILSLKEQEFVEAAKAIGASDLRIIFLHLIPNTLAYIIVSATLGMAGAILTESSLSFLGLGVIPPVPTWGNMIVYAKDIYILQNYPWLWIPPGIAILLVVVSINLVGDALRDAIDPRSDF